MQSSAKTICRWALSTTSAGDHLGQNVEQRPLAEQARLPLDLVGHGRLGRGELRAVQFQFHRPLPII